MRKFRSRVVFNAVALSMLSITTIGLISCEQKTTAEKMQEEVKEASIEVGNYFDDKRDALSESLSSGEKTINEKMANASEETKEGLQELKIELDDAMDNLKSSSKDNIDDIQEEVNKLIQRIENA